jgi:hypothetical protein
VETGWGSSWLCKSPFFNFGGIKAHSKALGLYVDAETKEQVDGELEDTEGKFQSYAGGIPSYLADHTSVLLQWTCVRNALSLGLVAVTDALGPFTDEDRAAMKHLPPEPPTHSEYSSSDTYPAELMEIAQEFGFTDMACIDNFAAL